LAQVCNNQPDGSKGFWLPGEEALRHQGSVLRPRSSWRRSKPDRCCQGFRIGADRCAGGCL